MQWLCAWIACAMPSNVIRARQALRDRLDHPAHDGVEVEVVEGGLYRSGARRHFARPTPWAIAVVGRHGRFSFEAIATIVAGRFGGFRADHRESASYGSPGISRRRHPHAKNPARAVTKQPWCQTKMESNSDNDDRYRTRDILLAFVRVHVLHHAVSERIFGAGMAQRAQLDMATGLTLARCVNPLLHRLEADGLLKRKHGRVVDGKRPASTRQRRKAARHCRPARRSLRTHRRNTSKSFATMNHEPSRTTETDSHSGFPLGYWAHSQKLWLTSFRRAGRSPGYFRAGVRRTALPLFR